MLNAKSRRLFPARPVSMAVVAAVLALGGRSANAADEYNYEITPFYGVMGGGSFEDATDGTKRDLKDGGAWGLAFNFAEQEHRQYEIFYAKQSTSIKGTTPFDLDIQYLQVGGTVMWADREHVIPYIVATVGAARLSPDAAGLDSTTRVAFTFGGGLRIPIVKHVGLRLEARGYASLLNGSGDVFCDSSPPTATCTIRAHSSTLIQYSATAGVIVGF
jgi:opacity protein-like surface antigen